MSKQALPLTPERSALAADHVATALRYARRYCRERPWLADEAESEALVVLAEAARNHRPPGQFTAYLRVCVRGAMATLAGKFRCSVLGDSAGGVRDRESSPASKAEEADLGRVATEKLAHLSRDRASVLRLRFGLGTACGDGLGPAEIARRVGRQPHWVAKTEREAIRALRGMFRDDAPKAYRGVRKVGISYVASARIDGLTTYIGTFPTAEQAARAFDRAVIESGAFDSSRVRRGGRPPRLNFSMEESVSA
jgi:RNA polymerase sigma factor (sigma-70 family)